MQRVKAKAALTASLLVDDRERHWSGKDAPPRGLMSSYRRSTATGRPVLCDTGAASAVGVECFEETFSNPAVGELRLAGGKEFAGCVDYDAPLARGNVPHAAPSSESKIVTALCSHGKQYKLAIWVSSQQRERIRTLAARQNQTLQDFLLAAIDEQLNRIGRNEEAEI